MIEDKRLIVVISVCLRVDPLIYILFTDVGNVHLIQEEALRHFEKCGSAHAAFNHRLRRKCH